MLQENIKRDKKSLCKELWEKSTDSKTTGRHFALLRCVIIWMLFELLVFCCSNKVSADLFIDLLQLYRLGELGDFSFSGKFHQSCFYLVFLFLFVYTVKTSLYILWNVKKSSVCICYFTNIRKSASLFVGKLSHGRRSHYVLSYIAKK